MGSVSCERSFSALRRLKLWTRSSMTEERLSGLAMLLIHRDTEFRLTGGKSSNAVMYSFLASHAFHKIEV